MLFELGFEVWQDEAADVSLFEVVELLFDGDENLVHDFQAVFLDF